MENHRTSPSPCSCGDPKCFARTAANYHLTGVPVSLRMLALLHAAGQDVSDYFDMRVSSTHQIKSKVPMFEEG